MPSMGESVNGWAASSVMALVGLALVSVTVRVAAWPAATVVGLNCLVTCNTELIDSEAVALFSAARPR